MNIPAEAVEAAAKAIASHYGSGANNWEWYLTEAAEVLEVAAPHMMNGLAASLGDATAEVMKLRSQLRRNATEVKTMAGVLIDHQRQDASSCLCGWGEFGHSHAEHQAQVLSDAGFGAAEAVNIYSCVTHGYETNSRDELVRHIDNHAECKWRVEELRPQW